MTKLKVTVGSRKSEKCDDNELKWSDLATNPGKKAMIIGIVLAALNQLCGCFAMLQVFFSVDFFFTENAIITEIKICNKLNIVIDSLQYTASIFKETGSSMTPNTSAIVVGVIQLIGSYFAMNLVERAGRKVNFLILSM